MRETYDKKQFTTYLLLAFVPAYLIQLIASRFYLMGNTVTGQLIIAAMMFVPALAAVLSRAAVRDMGWKPMLKKNRKVILTAWFSPLILTLAGSALYFLLFPKHFVLNGEYMIQSAGEAALAEMQAQGITYPVYILITALSSITYAPILNMFPALGEEVGWRGYMYPALKAKYGKEKGRILGGIIWGAWHWPLIALIGYEYGAAAGNAAGYAGYPAAGMLLFCVIAAALGILHDELYERSGTIWVPSLFHGAVNAAAALPLAVCVTNTGTLRLLGPAGTGLIGGLGFLIAAFIITRKR